MLGVRRCLQECKDCRVMVYPYRQDKLEKRENQDKIDPRKPHPAELCLKCQQLGYSCTTLPRSTVTADSRQERTGSRGMAILGS